jgi:small ligand-binding sensory domain FIST
MAKIEVREGDTLTIRVRVARVSDDGEKFTIEVAGQRYTGTGVGLDIVKHEKGANWPG